MPSRLKQILFIASAIACLTPWMSSSLALLLGVAFALTFGNPFADRVKNFSSQLLTLSVVGLGAEMNLITVTNVGLHGLGYTVAGIGLACLLGWLLTRALHTERTSAILITVGTAICGGSAIAAVAPVLRARPHSVSVSLAVVFLLNAIALLLFPIVSHSLNLSETQFGLWSALAIHDTSSVVGSTLQYGPVAVQIGTTIKLARALWIVPVTLAVARFFKPEASDELHRQSPKRPWFILGFVMMAALVTWFPVVQPAGHVIALLAKKLLVLTLFLIGSQLTRATLRAVGVGPFVHGVVLWLSMAAVTLLAVFEGWIS